MTAQDDTIVLDHLKLVLSHLQTVQNQLDSVHRRFSTVDQEFVSQTRLIANLAESQSQAETRMRKIEARVSQLEQDGADRHTAATLDDPAIRPHHLTNVRPLPHQGPINGAGHPQTVHHGPTQQGQEQHNIYGFDPPRR